MFLINNFYEDSKIHPRIIELFNEMIENDSLQNIILHGMNGTGKKYLIKHMLNILYGESSRKINRANYTITYNNDKKKDEIILENKNFIIIDPKKSNNDKYILTTVINNFANKSIIFNECKYKFKIIQINNIENLSFCSQACLRRLIENTTNNCKFILTTSSLDKVINPIKSRSLCIRVGVLSKLNQMELLNDICNREDITMLEKERKEIIKSSDGNLKTMLWEIEYKRNGVKFENKINNIIQEIYDIIILKINSKTDFKLKTYRDLIYKLLISLINPEFILINLLKLFYKKNPDLNGKIIDVFMKIDKKINMCRRDIFAFDYLFYNINM